MKRLFLQNIKQDYFILAMLKIYQQSLYLVVVMVE